MNEVTGILIEAIENCSLLGGVNLSIPMICRVKKGKDLEGDLNGECFFKVFRRYCVC